MRISDWSSDVCSSDLLFLQKEEKAPQRRCLPRSGSSRKRCPSITEVRQIVPVHMLKPAAQNHGSLNQITTIGEQRIGRSALLRFHHVKKTVNEGAVTHVCDASFYPVREAQSPPQPSFAPPVQGRPDAGPRRCGGRTEERRVGKEGVSTCR